MASRSILVVILLVFCSFGNDELEDLLTGLQKNIRNSMRFSAETNVSKTKLEVTPNGFIRYTESFKNGKQYYTSLKLDKFSNMNYLGTDQYGSLIFHSIKNDVIVQTYHDRAGDVDSMSNHLDIPMEATTPEQLNALDYQLRRIKVLLLQKQ